MGQNVSTALASCHKISGNETHAEFVLEDAAQQTVMQEPPKLGLRIFSNPCAESSGGALCARFLNLGNEVIATDLEKVKGWDPLRSRFEQSAKQRAGVLYTKGPSDTSTQPNMTPKFQWPEEYRFTNPRRYWKAKVVSQDGHGGFEEHCCMIVVGAAPEDRTHANVELDLKDSRDVASYASRFNQQLLKLFGDSGVVPGIRVCAPVGCEVIKSSNQDFCSPGEAITIIPYPFPEIKKFLFDGSEDFLEIPQAFFHHAAWLSSSNEIICDLQGIEDEDSNIILVDPCVIRAPKATVGSMLSTLASNQKENIQPGAADISSERFDALHPRCSQICKAFDPHRRSAHCRKGACGLNISCGV